MKRNGPFTYIVVADAWFLKLAEPRCRQITAANPCKRTIRFPCRCETVYMVERRTNDSGPSHLTLKSVLRPGARSFGTMRGEAGAIRARPVWYFAK
jgi:hypothetical protein